SESFERQRNLSFFSKNYEVNLQGVFYLKSYNGDYFRRSRIDPYVTLGIGVTSYNPMTKFNGQIYELRPLQTENVDYGKFALILPAAVGLKLRINDFVNLNLEIAYRYAFTDYLDDVSTIYPESTVDDFRSLLVNRKNEIPIRNPTAYNQQVAGAPRGNVKYRDQYFTLAYRLEIFIPNNKGPVLKKPSAY
ncbi:MAG: hypothetical protein ACI9DM_001749, partial [Cyclobacteriaceae bacterium]